MMNQEAIDHYKVHGYTVVDVFNCDEVAEMRRHFHEDMLKVGLDHDAILTGQQNQDLVAVRRKSPVSNMFYSDWKLRAQLRLHGIAKALMNATYSSGSQPGFCHPLGASDEVLPFIDHVGYRTPDHIRSEGGLSLHIDRNPHTPYNMSYFRPIQSSIALTDHYGGESGGIMVVPGFHRDYDEFFSNYIKNHTAEGGGFFRMHGKSYVAVQKRLVPLNIPAGSVIFWDNQLPHATCERLTTADSREVVFFSYLPDVPLNRHYFKQQMACMEMEMVPPCFGGDKAQDSASKAMCEAFAAYLRSS